MSNSDCIFCRIVAGQVPAQKVFEDEQVLAFMDVGPLSDGHTLLIPKKHYAVLDQCPAHVMAAIAKTIPGIASAVSLAMKADGYNVLCNNGRAAGQVVDHVHFHIIPRINGDNVFNRWPAYKYPQGKIEQIAEKIRSFL